jgi:hypothetical protein
VFFPDISPFLGLKKEFFRIKRIKIAVNNIALQHLYIGWGQKIGSGQSKNK